MQEATEVEPKTVRKGRAGVKSTDVDSIKTTSGSGKRGIRVKPDTVEEAEEDPLDFIDTPDEPALVAKPKRGARSRTATAEATKDEPGKDSAKSDTAIKTAAKKAIKAAPAKKVASTGSTTIASGESEDGVDKENAPSEMDEEPTRGKKVTRTKKSTKTTGSEMETDVPPTKSKVTRTTRARK